MKTAPATATKPGSASSPASPTTAEVDELIHLKEYLAPELARLKPSVDRADELTKKVRAAHEADPGNKTYVEPGTRKDLLVGEKREEATPDRKRIYKFFGVLEFVDRIATVSQAAVKEALKRQRKDPDGAEAFFTHAQTGWREITVIAKGPTPAVAAAEKKVA